MAEKIRFHLDEQMDPDIASALRSFGIDVTATKDVGLRGSTDEEQLEHARLTGRVAVSDDTDFLRLVSSRDDHPGVIFCRRTKHTLGQIIRFLILIHGVYEPNEMFGRVEYL